MSVFLPVRVILWGRGAWVFSGTGLWIDTHKYTCICMYTHTYTHTYASHIHTHVRVGQVARHPVMSRKRGPNSGITHSQICGDLRQAIWSVLVVLPVRWYEPLDRFLCRTARWVPNSEQQWEGPK